MNKSEDFINIDGLKLNEEQWAKATISEVHYDTHHLTEQDRQAVVQEISIRRLAEDVLGYVQGVWFINKHWEKLNTGSVRKDLETKLVAISNATSTIRGGLGFWNETKRMCRVFQENLDVINSCGFYQGVLKFSPDIHVKNYKIILMFLNAFSHLRNEMTNYEDLEYAAHIRGMAELLDKKSRPLDKLTIEMMKVINESESGLECRFYPEKLPSEESPYDVFFKYFFFLNDKPYARLQMILDENGLPVPVVEYFEQGINEKDQSSFDHAMIDGNASSLEIRKLTETDIWSSAACITE